MDQPTLIAGQPVATAEPRAVHLPYLGSEIKEARLELNRSVGQVGNLLHAHTSLVLESVPYIPPAAFTQLLPLRCGLSCKQMC
jgi:hypothetical protein